jgi:hypothetical protein
VRMSVPMPICADAGGAVLRKAARRTMTAIPTEEHRSGNGRRVRYHEDRGIGGAGVRVFT